MKKIQNYDKDNLKMKIVSKVQKEYLEHSQNSQYFDPKVINKTSGAGAAFAQWVTNIVLYRTLLEDLDGN